MKIKSEAKELVRRWEESIDGDENETQVTLDMVDFVRKLAKR